MITQDQAQAIALEVISRPDPYWPDRPRLVITKLEPHHLGWLIYYQSAEHLRTGSPSTALAGNGPLLVSREDGSYVHVGTASPLEDRIADAERELIRGRGAKR